MKQMSLAQITKACEGSYKGSPELLELEVSMVTTDSRKIEKGGLFIALKGERFDGNSYIPGVLESGALCAVGSIDYEPPVGCGYIRVSDTGKALKDIASYYRQVMGVKVVGITGSVGKTSTKETIAAFLSRKFNVLKTEGNFNNEIGVPLTIFRLKEEHEVLVLEMGINHFGEMSRLTACAKPDIAVITNIGNCHLEFLGDRDGVLKAKSEIFEGLRDDGGIFLNGDDDKLITITSPKGIVPVKFGFSEGCDVKASEIKSHGLAGSTFNVTLSDGTVVPMSVKVPGEHVIRNVTCASAVAEHLGVSPEAMQEAAASLSAMAGRGAIETTEDYIIMNDCYNANPASMRAALSVLSYAEGRKVAILGDMLELGPKEEELHREIGPVAAALGVDLLITVGRLGKCISEGAKSVPVHPELVHFDKLEELLSSLFNLLKSGDSILVKASHGMHFDQIVEMLTSK